MRPLARLGWGTAAASGEDDGAVLVGEDAVLEVPVDGAGEDDLFEVAAQADQVGDALAVRDALDVLFDDRGARSRSGPSRR